VLRSVLGSIYFHNNSGKKRLLKYISEYWLVIRKPNRYNEFLNISFIFIDIRIVNVLYLVPRA